MVKAALKLPYLVLVLSLMTMVLGIFCLARLPMDILPVFRIPAVMVVTTYTGMPARMIETDITNRLERWLSQASGLNRIESRSMIGVSILNCFFEPGFDPNNALSQISTLVMSDLHYLPPGTQPPIVMGFDPTASLPVATMTIFAPGFDEAKLWDLSNFTVRNQLNSVPGAIAPVVFGGKLREMMVFLNRDGLSGHDLSPMEVVDALKNGNAMIPTGDAKIGDLDYSITSNGMVPELEGFNDLPVKIADNAPVFIRDIGQIKDASAAQTNAVQVNGNKQTYIPLFRRVGANTVAVVEKIKAEIPNILQSLPNGSKLELLFDQSIKISDAVSDVIRELVVGVLLAALVIFFFLGSLKPTFVASLSIPLSVIGAMVGMYFLDQSLNLMTLGGLALATGPLIDKAVVVLENIESHLESGKSAVEASERGASEVAMPILVATFTLIIVFFPVTFFQGLGKFLFTPMAISVAISDIISYFVAMTVVPLVASLIFKAKPAHAPGAVEGGHPHTPSIGAVRIFNHYYEIFKEKYMVALDWAIAKPKVVSTLGLGALIVSCFLVPMLGTEFFPISDHGQFFIRMKAPTGTRLEKTTDLVDTVTAKIRSLLPKDSVKVVLANSGVIQSWAAAYSPNSASHDSLLEIEMNEHGSTGASKAIELLRPGLVRSFPGVRFTYSMIDPVASALNYGALSPVNLRISGPKLDEGLSLATDLLAKVKNVPGITDAFVEQELNYPSLHIEVDRIKAAYLGLTADGVVKNIITALNSSVLFAPNFWDDPKNGNNYFVGAQYPESSIDSIESIQNIPINPILMTSGKQKVLTPTLLRNIAQITNQSVPVEISHINIKRTFDIMANVTGRDIGSVASDIDRVLAKTKLPPSYSVKWGGSVDSMRSSFGDLGVGICLALVLVFLLLVAQLKSFLDPLLVLATVPMGFIGVFWMLFLTNTSINIQSMMGMIMLIAIVVSNTVILTDFANKKVSEGMPPKEAIRVAGASRLRPILMTAISTIMALIPSALSGANAPLARAVIGGLLTSTVLTLTFLPALFVLAKESKEIAR